MAQPYVGEIRMFAGNFAPAGWEFCDGRLISIAENETLFQAIGTTYGGDGQYTFALPDLRGRLPIHQGQGPGLAENYMIGQAGGVENVTLTAAQMPRHTHVVRARYEQGDTSNPSWAALALSTLAAYTSTPGGPDDRMAPESVGVAGSSQPHNNMMPYLCVNFIISMYGIFPSPN
jgi:Microcystin-dependent protein